MVRSFRVVEQSLGASARPRRSSNAAVVNPSLSPDGTSCHRRRHRHRRPAAAFHFRVGAQFVTIYGKVQRGEVKFEAFEKMMKDFDSLVNALDDDDDDDE